MNKYIHQITLIYLSSIILIRMMAMPISLIEYSIDRNYIAGNFCENRLNPDMHCRGKCYLNKQLGKSNESSESQVPKLNSKVINVDFFEKHAKFSFASFQSDPIIYVAEIKTILHSEFIGTLLRPPIA